jgi:peptide/nickel transport system permease protein
VLPPVLVMLVLAAGWGGGALIVVATMVLTGAPFLARLARAATLEVSQAPFVQVSVTQGDGTFTVLYRDVLPNVVGPVLADSGMRFVGALYLMSALGLLGFGPQPPDTNWAAMIRENAEGAGLNLWALMLPALMIAALSVAVNVILQAVADWFAR